jgi:hypothetical protein
MLALYKLGSTLQDKDIGGGYISISSINFLLPSKSRALDHTGFALVNSFFYLVLPLRVFFFLKKEEAILNNKKTIFS